MYKLFTKIITTRLEKKLDENQPREQAGFRRKYSTTDSIHAINQLKEKCREYNIPLCVYTDSSVTVHLHKESEKIRIKSKTGGHNLTQAVHGNIGEHI